MVWCEELVNHVPLFVDLCEEYDQARYVYLPLRTVSGSWWCEELVHHVPLFVDLCEEYDQARYVYLPLRTVSGS